MFNTTLPLPLEIFHSLSCYSRVQDLVYLGYICSKAIHSDFKRLCFIVVLALFHLFLLCMLLLMLMVLVFLLMLVIL